MENEEKKTVDIIAQNGYTVHLRDGRAVKEDEIIDGILHDWKKIKEITNGLKDITSIQIRRGGVYYTLSVDGNNVEILQLKANVVNLITGEDKLVERVLGFILKDDNGNPIYAVKMRIGEKTGGVKLSLEKKTDKGWVPL